MISPLLLAVTLEPHHWVFLGIAVTAISGTITAISVAMINRSTGKQDKKDETAVSTVAELTTSLSGAREEIAGLRSENTTLRAEVRWLRKQQEKTP